MTRVLADIPADDLERLDALAARERRSRAATLRDAVRHYLMHKGDARQWIERGAGLWKDREDIGDAVDFQRALRQDRTSYEDL